jgi:hypothetical protein
MNCPTCGKELSTQSGVRKHHTKVHGTPLPNRTCSDCGSEFYDPKARLEYCNDCNPNAGVNNGNWSDAQRTTSCLECGSEFEYYPSNKDGVYCSQCIEESDGLLPENPSEPMPRFKLECRFCGESKYVLPSYFKDNKRGVFCDLDCYGQWLSANIVGASHHRWKAGESLYAHGWSHIKRAALVRDEYECQNCGKDKSELGQNPDVHHIEPVRSFEDPRDAHQLDNVVCLCRTCHTTVEQGTIQCPTPKRK